MEIRILGAHNLETASSRMVSLLIDEVLAVDAGGLTSGLSIPQQERINSILLTHQHYDHVRDILPLALLNFQRTINVYATASTLDVLSTHLLDGALYPKFTEWPSAEKPALKLFSVEPYKAETIEGYEVLALPVSHGTPTVGYYITSREGRSVFYSSDTAPGLSSCWEYISPQLLIVELTMPNKLESVALEGGHLCPRLLREELLNFRQVKGYLPPVVLVHMHPCFEDKIREEIAQTAQELGASITLGCEGMRLTV
jgi:phosphoribosyl 1,2-cyclic phosphodiesterase